LSPLESKRKSEPQAKGELPEIAAVLSSDDSPGFESSSTIQHRQTAIFFATDC
jgi:hypothetical protein